jgi:hypothetical protein
MKMARAMAIAIAIVIAIGTAGAQTAPPPTTPGYTVSVNGGFSNVSNAPTNNGFMFDTELALSPTLSARGDVFVLSAPSVTISLASVQYQFPITKWIKNPTSVTVQDLHLFVKGGAGDAYSTGTAIGGNGITTQHKFAYAVGGGIEIDLSPTVHIRPLDLTYVRSSILQNGGAVLGNHLAAAATLGLQF